MIIQIIVVLIFAINLILIRLAYSQKSLGWYRYAGGGIFVLLPLLPVIFEQPRFELDYFWWRIAGAAVILLGAALIAWAARVLGNPFDYLSEKPKALAASGPYDLVRHPIYLGLIFVFIGWWWVWAAVYTFYFGMFILAMIWLEAYLEEKLLAKAFGAQFIDYRRRTGMFWIK